MRGWLIGVVGGLLAGWLTVCGEEITLTTYYPSPRGVYDELRANRVVLTDRATGKLYSLSVNEGRFLMTDVEKQQAFVLLELPDAAKE
jgi:hypothetical protein